MAVKWFIDELERIEATVKQGMEDAHKAVESGSYWLVDDICDKLKPLISDLQILYNYLDDWRKIPEEYRDQSTAVPLCWEEESEGRWKS